MRLWSFLVSVALAGSSCSGTDSLGSSPFQDGFDSAHLNRWLVHVMVDGQPRVALREHVSEHARWSPEPFGIWWVEGEQHCDEGLSILLGFQSTDQLFNAEFSASLGG